MAVINDPNTAANIAAVGEKATSSTGAVHVVNKPIPASIGAYRTAVVCTMATTQAANSRLFEIRNTSTNLLIPTRIRVGMLTTGTVTTAYAFQLDLFRCTSFSAVDTTNTVTPTTSVKRTTGMTDLAALGTSTPGGNSANRTAAGINTQSGATDTRMFYMVGTIEDLLIEPVLNAVIRFDRKFMDMKTCSNWLKLDPRFQKLDPVKVMNCRVTAEMRGSNKMQARSGFLQIYPMLSQTAFNPEFLQMLAQQQKKTINAEEFFRRLDDAINYSGR